MSERGQAAGWLASHRLLLVILAAFLILSATYSIVTPIFEAGDEIWHYPFVQYLATGHGLPIQDPSVETLWEQEGGQPPLYYIIAALATAWVDTRDLPDRIWHNPESKIGIPLVWGNKNMIVHTSAEDFPWHNTALAVHLIRFISMLLASGTVILTYLSALEIKYDQNLAAAAAALVAFNPMFIFISASVNNDNLSVLLATLGVLLLTRLITRGASQRRFVLLGIVLGLGALSKVSNLVLLAVAGVVFLYLVVVETGSSDKRAEGVDAKTPGHRPPAGGNSVLVRMWRNHKIIQGSVLCAAIVVVIAGWWYVRNWLLYGDPLAFNVWVAIAGGRPTPATLMTLLEEFQSFRISFWGNFGGVNIIAPDWVYAVLDGAMIMAGIGLLVGLVRRSMPHLLLMYGLVVALVLLGLIRWTFLTMASQGRLIFPAISAVAILTAYGLAQWKPPTVELGRRTILFPGFPLLSILFVGFIFVFSALAPFALIAPTYAFPVRMPDDSQVPHPTHIVFDRRAELVGYALPEKAVSPGGDLALTVYWRALEPIEEDLSVYIRLFDAEGNLAGGWNAFPGGGMYPTRFWQPGEVIADQYRVPLAWGALGPGVGRIEVGLYRRLPLENLPAIDPQGRSITPTIARFKINAVSSVEIQNPVRFEFGQKVALVGYSVENATEALRVRLYWRARQHMNEDYTVFLHLVDIRGNKIAQKDDQPLQGAYPTSFWSVGETVTDEYVLEIPRQVAPGDYQVVVGLYRAEDGTRLLIDGSRDSVVLATVPIGR